MVSNEWFKFLLHEVHLIACAGRLKTEIPIIGPQGPVIKIKKGGIIREVFNFCANNYLGLADSKDLRKVAIKAMKKWGYGMASVRFICGTQQAHLDLEKRIARFLGKTNSITYASCFDANALFEAIMKTDDTESKIAEQMVILSDELNHNSIITGMRLTKVEKRIYRHSDMDDLEKHLKEMKDKRLKKIVTDGVFSMDGELANLPAICELAQKYEAVVMVDDSHATGILGENGRGTAEHYGIEDKIDIVTSTFGKALGGGIGGFVAGPWEVIEVLRQRSGHYIYSNSLPPSTCAVAIKVFDILEKSPHLRKKLAENTAYFRAGMILLGFEIKGDIHPIVPVMIRDSHLVKKMVDMLLAKDILVVPFSYPVVPKGQDRIRVQISAAHETYQLAHALNAFSEVGKELGIIK